MRTRTPRSIAGARARLRHTLPAMLALVALMLVACSGDGLDLPGSTSGNDAAPQEESHNLGDITPAPSVGAPVPAMPGSGGAGEGPAVDRDESGSGGNVGGDGSLPSLQTAGRTIIRSGTVDLEVDEVDTSYQRVQQIAAAAGGFVAESSFSGSEEHQRATLTIRVPADRFQSVVDELRGMAVEVHSISTTSQDVTEEYTDLESSMRNLRAVETQYLELLGRAGEIGDVLLVQERLNGVRDQIERIEGRLRLLDNLSDLATLTVTLRPEDGAGITPAEPTGIRAAVRDAWESSLDAIEQVATVAVVAVVFSWWLIPVALVVFFVGRRLLRRRPATQPATQPAPVHVDTPGDAS